MGGDNFMVVASEDAKNSVQNFIDKIKSEDKILIQEYYGKYCVN